MPWAIKRKGIVLEDGKVTEAVSEEIRPVEPLLGFRPKKFAENILKRQHAERASQIVRGLLDRDAKRNDQEVHQAARLRILSCPKELSYREIQKLVRINALGKAVGSRQLLEKRLLTFFRRMDPHALKKMTRWEALHIRCYLDGDVNEEGPSEEKRAEWGILQDKEYVEDLPGAFIYKDVAKKYLESEKRDLKKRALRSFVADLEYHKAKIAKEEETCYKHRRYFEVMGAFYAAPAKTGRARCQICHEKIAKDTIRVSKHVLTKFRNRGIYSRSWYVRNSEIHFHATCFVHGSNGDTHSLEQMPEEDPGFLSALEDELVRKNRLYEKDKEYQRMLLGPVVLSYPGNTLVFGRENPHVVPEVVSVQGFTSATAKVPTATSEKSPQNF